MTPTTLDKKLNAVIDQLAESARASKIISINAALLAEQIQHGRTQNAQAIKVVASEIQRLSDESSSGIDALNAILGEVKLLTHTINLAGRQRMLSQKIMKLFLIQRETPSEATAREFDQLTVDFQLALEHLKLCRLNTPALSTQLALATEAWAAFQNALNSGDVPAAIALNERLLREVHAVVQHYEEVAGSRTVAA